VNVRPFEVLLVEDNPGDVLLSTEALEEAKLHINMSWFTIVTLPPH